jgi:hypothetical protein
MTQRNKLIVGVVVVLGAYYLYDRNKKMKAVSDLKAGAETIVEEVETPSTIVKTNASVDAQKELNFAGSRGNSMTAQYYR